MKGTIIKHRPKYRYGFIRAEDGEEIYFHEKSIGTEFMIGDSVEFDTEEGRKGLCAVNIKIIGGEDEETE